uniref:MLLT1 super elongation complex subunit b n=1 Tax=Neolamprologus brichardi TaxID=32507 RepID=A0A3Q4I282_NEOBR
MLLNGLLSKCLRLFRTYFRWLGHTHPWKVHFVEKVVFRLHESFPKPKRVCKEPPYKVEESGYAGFLMPIEVYFKNKEEPKKVCFNYDLFLNLEGNPPVNHLRCEKLTFNNPTKEFRRKLIKAGGVLVVPEGAEAMSRPSPDYPMLPTIPLSAFSDPKKTKTSHVSKVGSGGSSKGPKPHKLTKEHRERPRKDSESKAASKGDNDRDGSSKPGLKDEVKVLPKAAFKEPKITLKDSKMEGMSPKGGGAGSGPPEPKAPGKRPSTVESPKPSAKKQKKASSEGPKGPAGSGAFTGTSPRVSSSSAANQSYAEKKPPKEKGRWFPSKNDTQELKEAKKLQDSEESNSEDEASSKSEVGGRDGRFSRALKRGNQAYTEELVDLHRRLMALRERNVLQQIVNLIEETGHFNVTNTTFDFDLFSLDESTVRKLQSYLEATT